MQDSSPNSASSSVRLAVMQYFRVLQVEWSSGDSSQRPYWFCSASWVAPQTMHSPLNRGLTHDGWLCSCSELVTVRQPRKGLQSPNIGAQASVRAIETSQKVHNRSTFCFLPTALESPAAAAACSVWFSFQPALRRSSFATASVARCSRSRRAAAAIASARFPSACQRNATQARQLSSQTRLRSEDAFCQGHSFAAKARCSRPAAPPPPPLPLPASPSARFASARTSRHLSPKLPSQTGCSQLIEGNVSFASVCLEEESAAEHGTSNRSLVAPGGCGRLDAQLLAATVRMRKRSQLLSVVVSVVSVAALAASAAWMRSSCSSRRVSAR